MVAEGDRAHAKDDITSDSAGCLEAKAHDDSVCFLIGYNDPKLVRGCGAYGPPSQSKAVAILAIDQKYAVPLAEVSSVALNKTSLNSRGLADSCSSTQTLEAFDRE